MSPPDDTEQQALAYVYGELDGEEAHAFEARLEADAQLRAEVDGLMATRDMLDGDAQWSDEQGLDDPPPHLVGAILRAEALARPKEIRAAAAVLEKGEQSWVQRMSLWIIGGGAALTAAATLLIFVGQQTLSADESAPMAASAEMPAAAKADSAPVERAAEVDGLLAMQPRPAGNVDKEQNRPTSDSDEDRGRLDELASGRKGGDKLERATGESATILPEAEESRRLKDMLDAPADRELGEGKYATKSRAAYDDDTRAGGGRTEPARKPRPSSLGLSGVGAGGGAASAEPSPDTAGLAKKRARGPGGKSGASFGGEGVVDLAESDDAAPPPPAAAPAPVVTGAPMAAPPKLSSSLRGVMEKSARRSKRKARKAPKTSKEKKKAELRTQARDVERRDAINLHFATAERELTGGRPLPALDEFQHVHRLDPGGTIVGPAAVLGIMRANHALGRHKQVLVYVSALKKHGLKANGVAEGLLIAGDSAERLGQVAKAERFYADAQAVVATRKRAKRAMQKMRARQQIEMEAPAAAAADEP